MILTKVYIVDSIENQLGFTKQQSIDTVKTLLEIIKQNLKSGENILTGKSG